MPYVVSSDDTMLDWNASGNDRIIQNVLNIIRTRKFEVPFMREFGIDPDYIDSVLSDFQAEIISDVTQNIETYEPRVEVLNVEVDRNDVNGDIRITVELEVI